jgi:cyclic dehypoxanthinyl futalosine synthase
MNVLDQALEKASSFKRLDFDEALALLTQADLISLGELAACFKNRCHPASIVTYVVDRNINYTNICMSGCKFCAFYKPVNDPEGYVISEADLERKIRETLDLGGKQILLQGGMNPALDLAYYENLLKFISNRFPIHIHGFSPPEIAYLAEKEMMTVSEIISRLMAAGLDSIPGGGAEILVDSVRKRVSPNKCSAEKWLEVMRTAHGLGLRSTATMMFGHLEKPADIITHFLRIREVQDETGGFTAFIPWSFQPENTRIHVNPATSAEYLRILAVSRLVLDNVDNIQASWVTQGAKIAQVALFFGANDMGSTMIEENVVAAAGVKFRLPEEEIIRLIRDAGFSPARRNCFYEILERC